MSLKGIIPWLVGGAIGAQAIYGAVQDSSDLIRPPGTTSESDFMARCIKCGRCIEACPYVSIIPAEIQDGFAEGTPIIDVREQACRLCEDFPCIEVCPTDALKAVETRKDVDMGYAVINEDVCIAFQGMRCEVCYRVCPLIDEAIKIDYRMREGDAIHSVFAPIIDTEVCVGCGLCVERCVVDTPEVPIKIVRDPE
ncbi:MAG: 4Fe-4S dicluster domain-containing protein [Raoultibacter sp.]|jgi:ferredoxin-type protein NapG